MTKTNRSFCKFYGFNKTSPYFRYYRCVSALISFDSSVICVKFLIWLIFAHSLLIWRISLGTWCGLFFKQTWIPSLRNASFSWDWLKLIHWFFCIFTISIFSPRILIGWNWLFGYKEASSLVKDFWPASLLEKALDISSFSKAGTIVAMQYCSTNHKRLQWKSDITWYKQLQLLNRTICQGLSWVTMQIRSQWVV